MTDTWFYITCENQSVKLRLSDLGDGTFGIVSFTPSFLSAHIAGAATTTVKSGPGMLRRVVFNKAVALSVTTIYDNTAASGTILAVITMPLALLASQVPIEYDLKFTTGLTIVTSAADDLTIVYN